MKLRIHWAFPNSAMEIPVCTTQWMPYTGIILGLDSANERCYIVPPPFIGWAHIQNDPWNSINPRYAKFTAVNTHTKKIAFSIIIRTSAEFSGFSKRWIKMTSLWHQNDVEFLRCHNNIDLMMCAGIILGMGSANERRCYNVTPSLIGWGYTQNYPWCVEVICVVSVWLL